MAPPARFGRDEIAEDFVFLNVPPDGKLATRGARAQALGAPLRRPRLLLPGENDMPPGQNSASALAA